MGEHLRPSNNPAPDLTDPALIESILELTACGDAVSLVETLLRVLKHRLQPDAISVYEIRYNDTNLAAGDRLTQAQLVSMSGPKKSIGPILEFPAIEEAARKLQPVLRQVTGQTDEYVYPMAGRHGASHVLHVVREHIGESQVRHIEVLWRIWQHLFQLVERNELDKLTGLLNRVAFENRLTEIFSTGHHRSSDSEPKVLALIDIDHFKEVNDRYGHLYGDEVLVQLAHLMSVSFRGQDFVFRYGGEEFVVVLRDCTVDNARQVLDRFREMVAGHNYPRIGHKTVSIGMTAIDGIALPTTILDRADKALYFSKENGRNQCNLFEDLVEADKLEPGTTDNDNVELF